MRVCVCLEQCLVMLKGGEGGERSLFAGTVQELLCVNILINKYVDVMLRFVAV